MQYPESKYVNKALAYDKSKAVLRRKIIYMASGCLGEIFGH